MKRLYFFLLASIWTISINAKVLFITHNYNRPELIEMQSKTLKHFVQNEYELQVYDDSIDENVSAKIRETCLHCNVTYVRVPQHLHYIKQPCNIRHAEAINFSLKNAGFEHDGIVIIIDSDMFLVRPFDVEEYMKDTDISSFIGMAAGRDGSPIPHLYPLLVFLNMPGLPNKRTLDFSVGVIKGTRTDSGGMTYHYLTNNKLNVKEINRTSSNELFCGHLQFGGTVDNATPKNIQIAHLKKMGFLPKEIEFLQKKPDTFEYYLNLNFLHYRAGSNYENLPWDYHYNKTQLFNDYLNNIIQS